MSSPDLVAERGGPVVPSRSALRPLGPDEVRIIGGFWADKQELNASAILPHCETWMERVGWTTNFDRVATGTIGEHRDGIEFVDSEIYKLLEAMAWGLVPICTPTCGYEGIPGITNIPNGDAPAAAAIVRGLLNADESDLIAMQSSNWQLLDGAYNWDRFTADIARAIESTESPALLPESRKRRLIFTYYDVTSPYGRLATGRLGRLAARLRRRLESKP